jgi:endonuclease III
MSHRDIVRRLLREHGRTYAEQAGITLADKPSPLFRLLVLATLASTRIGADIAVGAARELSRAGWRTPDRMLESTWQERVDALGRAGYRRYDESTATSLAETCELLLERYGGDVRGLRPSGGDGVESLREALQEFPRLGPVGADIFCREVQAVWPEVRPFFDAKSLAGAGGVGLPQEPAALGRLVTGAQVANLAAALTTLGIASS